MVVPVVTKVASTGIHPDVELLKIRVLKQVLVHFSHSSCRWLVLSEQLKELSRKVTAPSAFLELEQPRDAQVLLDHAERQLQALRRRPPPNLVKVEEVRPVAVDDGGEGEAVL